MNIDDTDISSIGSDFSLLFDNFNYVNLGISKSDVDDEMDVVAMINDHISPIKIINYYPLGMEQNEYSTMLCVDVSNGNVVDFSDLCTVIYDEEVSDDAKY